MSDKALRKCPKCNKKVRRVIGGGVGLIFKGSGFYATDYKKQARPEPLKTEGACPKAKESCNGCPHA
jgi:predicted nucleic acid-binding Zn ribbon protein